MMTLIIKQILFDIIKTCMIYILYFSFSVWDSLRRTLGFSNPLSPFHPSSCEPSPKSPNGTTKAPLTTTTPLSQRQSSRTDKTQSKTIIKSNHQRQSKLNQKQSSKAIIKNNQHNSQTQSSKAINRRQVAFWYHLIPLVGQVTLIT